MVRTRSNRVFNQFSPKKSSVPSKKVKFSAPRQDAHAFAENEPIPLACLPPSAIVPYSKAPFCDEGDEIYSTPRGSSEQESIAPIAPLSPSPDVPNLGENRSPTNSSKPPKVVADQVFDEMPQRDNLPDLLKFVARPGFSCWSSRSHAFQQGLRPQFTPSVDNQNPESSSKKRSRSFSEESLHPCVLSSDDEEEVLLEAMEPVEKEKSSQQSTKKRKEKDTPLPSRVTRSAVKCSASVQKADFRELGIFDLLKAQHLLGTVTRVQPFVKNVVYEFYANLVEEMNNPASDMYHKVFVRGHLFNFSPVVINDFYERVKKPLAKLLFLIGTATTFDFGQLVFDQIISNAEATITHLVLPFPSLIYGILTKQHDVKKSDELFEKALYSQ
ncbi:uncharacterized protein LOC112091798 [Morus notabilis]|uniref:uncharacterized protein LOC112091798 n=1 Tax=Morus notabilis TaxID=981085 RepID=UPI000CED068A|nr:uncharacterized protein LOC112091798 [Morus notabilis]